MFRQLLAAIAVTATIAFFLLVILFVLAIGGTIPMPSFGH